MERLDGFLPIYLDRHQGRILLEIPRDSTRALLLVSQATGLGSNPIGIDRGASGETHVARFDHDGDRVLLVLENWAYRGSPTNPDHARAIAEAFPPSTVASMPLLAEENGRLLVDATDVALRDWNDVARTLAQTQQGTYTVARDRSGVYRPDTKAFPDNTEIDASLTFAASARPGPIVESIVPDGKAFTLRQHLSFVKLPDAGFRTRERDPRVGYLRRDVQGLRAPDPAIAGRDARGATPAAARRPERSAVADQGADSLLRRPRNPRAGSLGDPRGREVVGAGVRPRGARRRIQGRAAARGRRSDGLAVQRRAVGESKRARMVGRRRADRSAHGRDDQGHGATGFAPRAHRLQPLRRADGRRRDARRHRVRAGARPSGERARGGAHARPRAQLHRVDVRARVGDGLSAAAGAARRQRSHRCFAGVRGRTGRVRHLGDSLGVRRLPGRRASAIRCARSSPTACDAATCFCPTPTPGPSTGRIRG